MYTSRLLEYFPHIAFERSKFILNIYRRAVRDGSLNINHESKIIDFYFCLQHTNIELQK